MHRNGMVEQTFIFATGLVVVDHFISSIVSFVCVVSGKPQSIESSERVQLSGTYNVRKGKLQLPVNRWTRRQVILCGTCLIVSSIKESQTGKMHILPLIGGKVRSPKCTDSMSCHQVDVVILSWFLMTFPSQQLFVLCCDIHCFLPLFIFSSRSEMVRGQSLFCSILLMSG